MLISIRLLSFLFSLIIRKVRFYYFACRFHHLSWKICLLNNVRRYRRWKIFKWFLRIGRILNCLYVNSLCFGEIQRSLNLPLCQVLQVCVSTLFLFVKGFVFISVFKSWYHLPFLVIGIIVFFQLVLILTNLLIYFFQLEQSSLCSFWHFLLRLLPL